MKKSEQSMTVLPGLQAIIKQWEAKRLLLKGKKRYESQCDNPRA